MPGGYKASPKIATDAEQAIVTLDQKKKERELQEEKRTSDSKNRDILKRCTSINPKPSKAAMTECLSPVIGRDPDNEEMLKILNSYTDKPVK